MNFNPLKWFKNRNNEETADIDFRDVTGEAFELFPIQRAQDVPVHFSESQKEIQGKMSFPLCPGIWDYSRYGYIMPAWENIKIKANKAGTVVFYKRNKSTTHLKTIPSPMEHTFLQGAFEYEDGVPPNAYKCDSPWKVFCKEDISAFLIPAVYHSKFLDDLFVVPGIVDYKSFHAMNFIFSVKRECEITIKAGEPLLHILPFFNKPIKANYGLVSLEEYAKARTSAFDIHQHFYRKELAQKKTFPIDKEK